MTRYFYTDPLAAAWMNKHFGMQFTRTHCHRGDGTFGESTKPVPIWILARDVENQVSENVKYYVHPDSLHLLEPLIGDVCITKDDGIGYCSTLRVEKEIITGKLKDYIQLSGFWAEAESLIRIMERSGVVYHWPDSEEA
jgi:hypothetical protein